MSVGTQQIESPDGRGLDAAGFKALKDATAEQVEGGAGGRGLSGQGRPGADELRA